MDKFFLIIYNGLKQVKLPLLGFTDLSLWDFLLSFSSLHLFFLLSLASWVVRCPERRGLTGSCA